MEEEKKEKKQVIVKANKTKKQKKDDRKDKIGGFADTPVSIDGQEILARLMNNSPTISKLKGTEWEISCLKPGVQWLIAEEAVKIVKVENASMGDVIKQFAVNMPSVVRVLSLAMLNDKERIFSDYRKKEYSDEYHACIDTLLWEKYDIKDWSLLLFEVLSLLNLDFFFESSNCIQIIRQMSLERKTTMSEQKQ